MRGESRYDRSEKISGSRLPSVAEFSAMNDRPIVDMRIVREMSQEAGDEELGRYRDLLELVD